MLIELTAIMLVLAVVVPIVLYIRGENRKKSAKVALISNMAIFFTSMVVITILLFAGSAFAAGNAPLDPSAGLGFIAAGIATGLATVGAGIAVGAAASAALGAISENEKLFGKALIFVALAEGVALYGLIVSFMIISRF